MAANPEKKLYTMQQYITMLQDSDQKIEYDHGEIHVREFSTSNHVRISQNMCRALDDALGDDPVCVAYMADKIVAIADEVRFMPDVVVSCNRADHGEAFWLEAPHVVVEVQSHSTEARDRTYKLAHYKANEHVQEIVFISQYVQQVEVFTRTAEDWEYRQYGSGQEFPLASLDITLAVADIYRRLTIPAVSELEEMRS